jgi:transposase-like protein
MSIPKIPKQEYTAEFKELAVKRVKGGRTAGAVAKELGLIEQTLRNWVKAYDAGRLNGPGCGDLLCGLVRPTLS